MHAAASASVACTRLMSSVCGSLICSRSIGFVLEHTRAPLHTGEHNTFALSLSLTHTHMRWGAAPRNTRTRASMHPPTRALEHTRSRSHPHAYWRAPTHELTLSHTCVLGARPHTRAGARPLSHKANWGTPTRVLENARARAPLAYCSTENAHAPLVRVSLLPLTQRSQISLSLSLSLSLSRHRCKCAKGDRSKRAQHAQRCTQRRLEGEARGWTSRETRSRW